MKAVRLLLIALLGWSPVFAQGSAGEIWGRVATTTGEVVEGAPVTATNIDTGAERKTKTDASGRFGFAVLAPGRYQVTATHQGFAGRRQDDIVLLPGQRMQIDLPLRRAPLPETIAVNPYPPIMESARTHASGFVADTEIEHLPVAGRRYLRLTELIPAVTTDAATGGISVMNLPSASNQLAIDGFDHTSSITGEPVGGDSPSRAAYQLGQSSVQAFRIETNGAPAENGRATASVIKVVTKSGANAFQGSTDYYFGDRKFNGDRALDEDAGRQKPAYRSHQFSATLGGPLQRDHHFFLVNYDRLALTDAASASRSEHQDVFFARTDHDYAGQHLMLRYLDQRLDGTPAASMNMQPSMPGDDLAFLRTRSAAGSLANAIGSAVVNEARGQYSENRDEEDRGSLVGQTGASRFGPHRFTARRVQMSDTLSLVGGSHSVKLGGDVLEDRNATRFGPSTTQALQTLDTGWVEADVTRYSAFVQDAWRATPALTLDLGVRYDQQDFADAVVPPRRNNWGPRAGFAFSPGDRRTVIRGAYGLFYGSTPALIPALAQAFNARDVRVLPASFIFVDPSFKTPRVHQATVGWEVEKYRAGSAGVAYLFARGEHLPRPVDVNLAGRFPAMNRVVSFESTGQSVYNGLTAHARGRVLQMLFYTIAYTLSRSDETPLQPVARLFGELNGRGSLAIQDDTLARRAPGLNDRHQHLAGSAMYDTALLAANHHGLTRTIIKDWEFGLTYAWQTGQPFSAFVNGDVNGDHNAFNDVAPGTTWNQYRLPYQGSLNPRVARHIGVGGTGRLWLIWEAFNVTNRPNYTAVDDIQYSLSGTSLVPNPLFGRRTGQGDGRMMHFAAGLSF